MAKESSGNPPSNVGRDSYTGQHPPRTSAPTMENILVQTTRTGASTTSNYPSTTNQAPAQGSSRVTSPSRGSSGSGDSSIPLTTRGPAPWGDGPYTLEVNRGSRSPSVAPLSENRRRRMPEPAFGQAGTTTRAPSAQQSASPYASVPSAQQSASPYASVPSALQFSNSFPSDYEQPAEEEPPRRGRPPIIRPQSSQPPPSLQSHFERIERGEGQSSAQHTRKVNRRAQKAARDKKKKSN